MRRNVKMVKVRCEYSDGNDWFEEYTEDHEKVGLAYVEITEDEWNSYLDHCVECRLWNKFIKDMANIQWEKDEPKRKAWEEKWIRENKPYLGAPDD